MQIFSKVFNAILTAVNSLVSSAGTITTNTGTTATNTGTTATAATNLRVAGSYSAPVTRRATVAFAAYADATNRFVAPTSPAPRHLIINNESGANFVWAIVNSSRACTAVAATLTRTAGAGEILFTAVTPGAAGNSITITMTDGGAGAPTVITTVGTDIDVSFDAGVTLASAIVTEITTGVGAGAVAARALVTPTTVADFAMDAEAVASLAGGVNADSEAARATAIAVAATTTTGYRFKVEAGESFDYPCAEDIVDVIMLADTGNCVVEGIYSY